jgi:hypothetical protein
MKTFDKIFDFLLFFYETLDTFILLFTMPAAIEYEELLF